MEQNQQQSRQQQWQGPERRQSQGHYTGAERRRQPAQDLDEAAGGPGVIPQADGLRDHTDTH